MTLSDMILRVLRLIGAALLVTGFAFGVLWWTGKPSKDLQGIWITNGYGLVVQITPFTIALHEITPVSCLPSQKLPAHIGLARRLAGYSFDVQGDDLTVGVADVIDDIRAYRVDALPDQCLHGKMAGPLETFDVFWRTFDTHYPNFELYGVDWDTRRAEALEALADNFDPKHLSDVMANSVRGLEDAHVNLMTPSGDFSPLAPAPWDKDQRTFWQVTDSYLVSERQFIETSGIRHGWLENRIAYIGMHHMETEPPLGQAMVDEAERVVAQLSQTYAEAKGVIVDLRTNSGGSDPVALTYAGLFSATDWPAGSKTTQILKGYMTGDTPFSGHGAPAPITAPVVVLTSSETVSAAEIYVMAVRELPQVTVMGENTTGSLSDLMVRSLPNKWHFTLPHQVYTSVHGEAFEGAGIPPDVPYAVDAEGFARGKDTMLEAALARLSDR
ncbi:S41 family peptidase [Celeribacter sp.]|uniref:S41 family peptidase n=1 Tax=Celeribacter sp. TaxID=1890673 RepID=UPI003A8F314C